MRGRKVTEWGWILAAGLLSREIAASEPSCVTATFYGVDNAFEDAVREQLKNELRVRIADNEKDESCWRLVIEMRGDTVRILIDGDRVIKTKFDLGEVTPALRPRAIALSFAGFMELSKTPEHHATPPTPEETAPVQQAPGEKKNVHSKTAATPTASTDDAKSGDVAQESTRSSGRIGLHLLAGVRLVPKFRVGLVVALPGIDILIGALRIDLSLVGLWGRKSVDMGRIHSAGLGARLTLWRRIFHRNRVSIRLGPAAEAVGLWGWGKEKERVTSHTTFLPVVDILFLLGGSLTLTPRIDVSAAIGGGWTTLYAHMKADDDEVSGLDGGIATLTMGIEFNI